MDNETNRVLEKLRFDGGMGALDYNGIRYLLIRPETLVEIQKVCEEKFGPDAAREIFYRSGFRGTSLTADRLLKGGMSSEECLRAMFAMGSHLGWGKFELPDLRESGKETRVTIHASPFARAYGKSKRPVCALLSGALAGIFTTLRSKEHACREIKCLATGEAACRFLLEEISL